jgi:hypothetical protein
MGRDFFAPKAPASAFDGVFSPAMAPLPLRELVTGLTDYAIALETAMFAVLLSRRRNAKWAAPLALFFAGISIAALLGGTVHMFLHDGSVWNRIAWSGTLVALAMAAFAGWRIGGLLIFSPRVAFVMSVAAACEFIVYCLFVFLGGSSFLYAIVNYLPSVVFCMVALGICFARTSRREALIALIGLFLTLIASAIQSLHIALWPPYIDHNSFYHLLEAVALYLIYWGGSHQSEQWARPASISR